MKRHLRKTKQKTTDNQKWQRLLDAAIHLAQKNDRQDLLDMLKSYRDDPETVLRRFSIISKEDLYREFNE
jgi:Trp operon repressor